MPKDTFYNLENHKREKILDATNEQFTKYRYSEASINRIVKASWISRGSFYQYFEDKEDLYDYLIDQIREEKRELIQSLC